MAGSPREQWERLQVILQNRARGGGGGGGGFRFGGGRPLGGPAAAIAVLVAGGYLVSTALFNGKIPNTLRLCVFIRLSRVLMIFLLQSMVVTELSSIPGYPV